MKKNRHKSTFFKNVTVNPVIRLLTYSDIMFYSGWGFINPILAIYFTDRIQGGDVKLAGIAIGIYFLVKSIVQIPVARYIDLEIGENDDYWVMFAGSIIVSLIPFFYLFISQPWQVYCVQVLQGIGAALSFPPWPAIFTRHIDKHEEGLEWSLYYSATDLGTAVAGVIGGVLAASIGYNFVLILVGVFSIFGTLFLMPIKRKLRKVT
jgi:MFS family permease